jgi:hypothetical protein
MSAPALRLARGAPEVFFKYEPVAQTRITEVQLQNDVAVRADPGRECKVMLAVPNLLVGDLDSSPVAKNRLDCKHRSLAKITTQGSAGLMA